MKLPNAVLVFSCLMVPILASAETHGQNRSILEDFRHFGCRMKQDESLSAVVFAPNEISNGYTWTRYPNISFQEINGAMVGQLEDTYYRFDHEKYVVIDWAGNVVQGECVDLSSVIAESLDIMQSLDVNR
jgi:hypothetical protein